MGHGLQQNNVKIEDLGSGPGWGGMMGCGAPNKSNFDLGKSPVPFELFLGLYLVHDHSAENTTHYTNM